MRVLCPALCDTIYLDEEDDRTLFFRSSLKYAPQGIFAVTEPFADNGWSADKVERRLRLVRNDPSKIRLSGARRAGKDNSFNWTCTNRIQVPALVQLRFNELNCSLADLVIP